LKFTLARYAFAYSVFLLICFLPINGQGRLDEYPVDGAVMSERTSNKISLSFSASEPQFRRKIGARQEFFTLHIPGFHHSRNPGRPELPVYTSLIDISGIEVGSIKITDVKSKRIFPGSKGYSGQLYPSQPSYTKNQNPQDYPFVQDVEFYRENKPVRADTVNITKLGTIRGQTLAQLSINPVIYYPADNYYDLITSLKVEIETIETGHPAGKIVNTAFSSKGLISKGISDYGEKNVTPSFTLSPSRMIILSDTAMRKHMKPLVDWKTKKGFDIIELYVGDNGLERTFESIKDTLSKIWLLSDDENPHPDFLIIGGDINIIPHSNGSDEASDLYYCEFDGGEDFLPEMYFGRLPARDSVDMKSIVKKILDYEMFTLPDTINHYRDAILLAGVDDYQFDLMDGQLMYANENYLFSSKNITPYLFRYQSNSQLRSEMYDSARTLIGDGTGFINYTGHGSKSEWVETGINYSFIESLSNIDQYPVIISNACQTGDFGYSDNMGKSFVRGNDRGALAFIGSTVNTYWDEDFWWAVGITEIFPTMPIPTYEGSELGVYDRLFHTHGENPSDWYTSLSQIIFAGNLSVLSSTSQHKIGYWEYYNLLGDPSVIPYIGRPTEFDVTIPDSIPEALTKLSINSDPFSYAALSHFDTLWDAAVADISGYVQLNIPSHPEKDSCLLVITGQNRIPVIKTLYFTQPDSAWLDITDVVPVEKSGNFNDSAEYGESFSLDISIQNAGLQPASGAYLKLASGNEYITIESPDSIPIGDIAELSEISLTDKFLVNISDSIPDNTSIQFTLRLFYGENIEEMKFNVMLYAPEVSIISDLIDDQVSGNGNFRPEAGETIDIIIDIINNGSSSISGILNLFDISPYLSVGVTNQGTGILDPGDTISITFSGDISGSTPDNEIITYSASLVCDRYISMSDFSFIVGGTIEDFETANFISFPWKNDESFPWIITSDDAQNNVYSAMSGLNPGDNNHTSSLHLTLNTPVDGNISFWYRLSSEYFEPDTVTYGDKFTFLINDTIKLNRAGELTWRRIEYEIKKGVHKLEWRYNKDQSDHEGLDRAWIDMIQFPATSFLQSDISIDSLISPSEPTKEYGDEQIIARVENLGRDTIYSLPLSYQVNDALPVNELFSIELHPGNSQSLTFNQSADLSPEAEYFIKVFRSTPDDYVLNDTILRSVISTDIADIIRNSDDFTIGPNPFSSVVRIISHTDLSETKISMYDSRGRKIWEYSSDNISDGEVIEVNGEIVSSGLYILKIDSTIGSYLYKLVKK